MTNEEAKLYWLNHERVDDKEQSNAVWVAINAIDKQIAKRPINVIYDSLEGRYMEYWNCPTCEIQHGDIVGFCSRCGQKIDWNGFGKDF